MLRWIDRLAGWWMDRRMARQAADAEGVTLTRAELLPDQWRIDLLAPNLIPLISEAAAMLDAQQAKNYIEFDMLPRADHTDGRAIRVTIQWITGESPAQQNARLREELARLQLAARTFCEERSEAALGWLIAALELEDKR
jgi:hypothetical protein